MGVDGLFTIENFELGLNFFICLGDDTLRIYEVSFFVEYFDFVFLVVEEVFDDK